MSDIAQILASLPIAYSIKLRMQSYGNLVKIYTVYFMYYYNENYLLNLEN